MRSEERRAVALAMLEAAGIWRSNYAPPILRLLWALGIDAPPPHFASARAVIAFTGSFFGVAWGLFMWFTVWSRAGLPLSIAFLVAAFAGVLFGAGMAAYYRYSARKHGLPRWQDLGKSGDGA